jgi:peptide/nickel transport system substrate-binding protein
VHAASDPNTLTLAILYWAPDLDPQTNYDVSAATYLPACYDSLVRVVGEKKGTLVPDLATSWSQSPDGKVWTFKIRSGVKFHDGTPLDAAAIKFSFDRLLKLGPALAGASGDFSEITKVEAVNPTTVRFYLQYPFSSFLTSLTTIWGTGIVSPTAVKKHIDPKNPKDFAHAWLLDHEAGSGPYMLTSYDRNTGMTLTKFPGYWRGWSGKHFDRVVTNFIAQSTTQRLELQRGDLDGTMGLSWQDFAAVAKDPNIVAREYTAQTIKDIRINNRYGPTANPLVRQALSYAWDYQGMVAGAYQGHAAVMAGIEPTGFAHFVKPAHPYTFDLNKAKALFAKAGYGKGLTLTYYYFPAQQDMLRMGEIFQSDLAQIGVTLKLQGINSATYTQLGRSPRTVPQIFGGAWTMDYADDQQGYWLQYTVANNPNVVTDNKIDQLVLAGMKSTDDATAMRYYTQAVNRIHDEAISIWSVQPNDAVALRSDIKGYQYNYLESSYNFPLYNMYRG